MKTKNEKRKRGRPIGSSGTLGVRVGDIVKLLKDDYVLPVDRKVAMALFKGVQLYEMPTSLIAEASEFSEPEVTVQEF